MNSGEPEIFSDVISDVHSSNDRVNHDIRASLAITSGFNQAMESSFSELCTTFEQILDPAEPQTATDKELRERLEQLEADCRFCISRIHRALEKLDGCVNSQPALGGNAQEPTGLNHQ